MSAARPTSHACLRWRGERPRRRARVSACSGAARRGDDEPALARPDLPALGGRPGGGRAPDAARRPSRHPRRRHLRRADPVPDGRCRGRPRSGRPLAGLVPRDQRAALLRRRDRAARHRVPQPRCRPCRRGARGPCGVRPALPLGADAPPPRAATCTRTTPASAAPARRASSHIVVRAGARRDEHASSTTSSAPGGGCTSAGGAGRSTSPTTHEAWPVHDAEVLALDDGLMASVGLPDLAARPPDHVGFSPGVFTEFGFPGTPTPARLSPVAHARQLGRADSGQS